MVYAPEYRIWRGFAAYSHATSHRILRCAPPRLTWVFDRPASTKSHPHLHYPPTPPEMLTKPEVDEAEAKAEAEANSHEAKAKIASTFFSQIFHSHPIFSKKPNFLVGFQQDSNISAQNGL